MKPEADAWDSKIIGWLMEGDPAIRWQVLRDLLDAPEGQISRERAKIAREGWGKTLLDAQGGDGTWGGVAWNPGNDSTMHVLTLLRIFGLDPQSPAARRAIARVEQVTFGGDVPWSGNRFFEGETEHCINGQIAASGAYFGVNVRPLIERLLAGQLSDGGWNCDSDSEHGSFNTTICVLEALLEYEMSFGGEAAITMARQAGEGYLLERHLFCRKSTGDTIFVDRHDKRGSFAAPAFFQLAFPPWWHYNILRALDYFSRSAKTHDERLHGALAHLKSKQRTDGRWNQDILHRGTMPVDLGEYPGEAGRWNTLQAMRVLSRFGKSPA